jgi:UDP-glucose 4-epimerase
MKVWITGAHGFIGRHAAHAFAARGDSVAGLGHGAWTEADHRSAGVVLWRNGEVSHANLDAVAAHTGAPDAIVHLAGGSAVGASFAQPAEDLNRSVAAAAALAEWVRLRAPAAALVMASSAAVYGAGHAGPIAESALTAPFSPYGYHKRMAELLLESYARNFGLRCAVLRLFSVYGPGLRKQLLWDACTRLAQSPTALALGGSGGEMRDWLHVADACSLLIAAVDAAGADCPIFNGGTGVATPIRDIASTLCLHWGTPTLAVSFSGQSRPGDPHSLVADIAAARALGWQPQIAWHDGLADYVAWFKARQAAEVA